MEIYYYDDFKKSLILEKEDYLKKEKWIKIESEEIIQNLENGKDLIFDLLEKIENQIFGKFEILDFDFKSPELYFRIKKGKN